MEISTNYNVHVDSVVVYEDDFRSCLEELSTAVVRGAIIGNGNNSSLPSDANNSRTELLDGKFLDGY